MRKSIITCIALVALVFTNSSVFAKSSSDKFAIMQCIQSNLDATEDEDFDAFWETCKPSTEQEKEQLTAFYKQVFETYDLSYEIETYKLLKLEGDQAVVEVVVVTKKISGPEFNDNRSTSQHVLNKIDGQWYIVKSILVKAEPLNGKPNNPKVNITDRPNESDNEFASVNTNEIENRLRDENAIRKCVVDYYKALEDHDINAVLKVCRFRAESDIIEMNQGFLEYKQKAMNGIVVLERYNVKGCKIVKYDGKTATAEVNVDMRYGNIFTPGTGSIPWNFIKIDGKWYLIGPHFDYQSVRF